MRKALSGSSSPPQLFHSSDPGSQQPPSLVTDEEGPGNNNRESPMRRPDTRGSRRRSRDQHAESDKISKRNPTKSASVAESARPAPQAQLSTQGKFGFTGLESRKARGTAAVNDPFTSAIPGVTNRLVS